MKFIHLVINFLRWYVDGLRQPTLNAIARMILVWSFSALAAISLSVSLKTSWLSISLSSGSGASTLFIGLVVLSVLMLIYGEIRDKKIADDSQLITVRHMGLINHHIDDVGNHLPSLLKKIKPQRFNIEFGDSHKTQDVEELQKQVNRISRLSEAIEESGSSLNNSKKHIVYSGVAPVPMVAAVGHLVSNMQNVMVADWDRKDKKWHFSSNLDDGEKFEIRRLDENKGKSSANIAISLSLPIDVDCIEHEFPDSEMYTVSFQNGQYGYDKLSSATKQERLVREILEFINNVIISNNRSLVKINFFIAAQASFVFRLGSALNQGHLPKVVFHHFNPDHPHKSHPWGVGFNGNIKGYELVL